MRSNNQQENQTLTPLQKQAVLVCIVCALAALLPPAAPCPAGTAAKSTVPSAPDCFTPETAILLPA